MTGEAGSGIGRHGNRRRVAIWATAALLWLTPLVAMQCTEEVVWGPLDFAVFGAMLAGACGTYELATRMSGSRAYRAAVAVAVGTAFIVVWVNLAVGVIGDEGNPANLMFGAVLAIGVVAAVLARFRPEGMERALVVTASAQAVVAVMALVLRSVEGVLLTMVFVALWLISARLFRQAARERNPAEV